MPRVSPEHEEARREQILKAAEACFTRKGYHRTTVDDIVAEAGLSKGAIYTYFKSKKDILVALEEHQSVQEITMIHNLVSPNDDLKTKIEKIANYIFEPLISRPELCDQYGHLNMELWAEAARDDQIRRRLREDYQQWLTLTIRLIQEGISRGEVRPEVDPEAVAGLIIAATNGLGLRLVTCGPVYDIPRVRAAFIDMLKATLLRNPS